MGQLQMVTNKFIWSPSITEEWLFTVLGLFKHEVWCVTQDSDNERLEEVVNPIEEFL